jgi:hypothetical protein
MMMKSIISSILMVVALCGCRALEPESVQACTPASTPAETAEQEYDGETVDILAVGLPLGEKQGVYRFRPDEPCTVLHLIFKMGGIPGLVEKDDVRIIRKKDTGEEEEIPVDLRGLLETGDPKKDVPLKHGDRVIFPARLYAI